MKPSSGESAPLASRSRSESSRRVSGSCSSRSTPSGRPPVRSTSLPPCGAISRSVSRTVTPFLRKLVLHATCAELRRGASSRWRSTRGNSCGVQHKRSDPSRRHLLGNKAQLLELGEDERGALVGAVALGVEDELRVLR